MPMDVKNCPDCDGKAPNDIVICEGTFYGNKSYSLKCKKCGFESWVEYHKDDAIRRWNSDVRAIEKQRNIAKYNTPKTPKTETDKV